MIFDALPDLTPRDSHVLWYTSLRNPHLNPSHLDSSAAAQSDQHNAAPPANPNNPNRRPPGTVPLERTPLGRLRADEAYMARRLANISNFGSTWLKPPGVAKSLYQMREERREAEEHAEAVRREQLAAELAEAEAAQGMGAGELMVGGEGGEMDGMESGAEDGEGDVDLDDEIPDADEGGLGGFGYEESESEEEEEDEEEDDEDEDEDDIRGPGAARAQQRELASRMASMRATEDRLRELMARGGDGANEEDVYGVEGDEVDDEVDQSHILEEEDLVHDEAYHLQHDVEPGMDLDMDANLDDDIPEAESVGGYEHTDSDAELTSSDDNGGNVSRNVSFGAGRGGRGVSSAARLGSSLASAATRNSLDINSILSRDGSSTMGSSPQIRRRN